MLINTYQIIDGQYSYVKNVLLAKNTDLPSYFTDKSQLEKNHIPEAQQHCSKAIVANTEQSQEETV